MREIKFRARSIHNSAWCYGYFCKDYNDTSYITTIDGVETTIVDPYTLGQFTGLTDKNGKEVFEGDTCKVIFYNHIEKNTEMIMNIVSVDGGFALIKDVAIQKDELIEDDRTFVPLYYSQRPNSIEIIGNIHENTELTNV